jgi:hypothetical protein
MGLGLEREYLPEIKVPTGHELLDAVRHLCYYITGPGLLVRQGTNQACQFQLIEIIY